MKKALRNRDAETLWQAAHTMKTNNATVGAVRMTEICHQLEVAGREGNLNNSDQLLAELGKEFLYIENHLQRILIDNDLLSSK